MKPLFSIYILFFSRWLPWKRCRSIYSLFFRCLSTLAERCKWFHGSFNCLRLKYSKICCGRASDFLHFYFDLLGKFFITKKFYFTLCVFGLAKPYSRCNTVDQQDFLKVWKTYTIKTQLHHKNASYTVSSKSWLKRIFLPSVILRYALSLIYINILKLKRFLVIITE